MGNYDMLGSVGLGGSLQVLAGASALSNAYNQQLAQSQWQSQTVTITGTSPTVYNGNAYTIGPYEAYGALPPSKPLLPNPNQAWLDKRVNEMRIAL